MKAAGTTLGPVVIPEDFSAIGPVDVQRLVDDAVPEGHTVEYKETLYANSVSGKREFLADVSSFANASGGDLLLGIRAALDAAGKPTGAPDAVVGLDGLNPDSEILRHENMLRTGVDPRISGVQMRSVGRFAKGPVLWVRVPRSRAAPHRVISHGGPPFYARGNAGKYPLDTAEILRIARSRQASSENGRHQAMLDAVACHEVRKLDIQLHSMAWQSKRSVLELIGPYAGFGYGYPVRAEILSILDGLASRAWEGMPTDLAASVASMTLSSLGVISLVAPAHRKTSSREKDLLTAATGIGFSMAYYGIKRGLDLKIIDAGSQVLWDVLRYAHLNHLTKVKKDVLEQFQRLEAEAAQLGRSDAERWLVFRRQDALALDGETLPALPGAIAASLRSWPSV